MNNRLTTLLEKYQNLLEQKEEIAAAQKRNNENIEMARNELVAEMLEEEIDSVTYDGFSYTLTAKTRYSKKAGSDDALFDLLRDHGLGDLIRETVNAQTLQGAMSEEAKANDGELPEEWLSVINVFSFTDITKRKKSK